MTMTGKELRIREYERGGTIRISGMLFMEGVGGKGFDIPISKWNERQGVTMI